MWGRWVIEANEGTTAKNHVRPFLYDSGSDENVCPYDVTTDQYDEPGTVALRDVAGGQAYHPADTELQGHDGCREDGGDQRGAARTKGGTARTERGEPRGGQPDAIPIGVTSTLSAGAGLL